MNARFSFVGETTTWNEPIPCKSLKKFIYTVKGNYLKYSFLCFVSLSFIYLHICYTKNGVRKLQLNTVKNYHEDL